jgi:hypothetical protein
MFDDECLGRHEVYVFRLTREWLCSDYHLLYYQKMRYYEQKYPEVDELVMVQVRQIAEMGAYVKLVRESGANHFLP